MSSQEQVASRQRVHSEKGYRRVIAFTKADELASMSFDLAKKVEAKDRWLASQLMRASLSAPLNIVEGHGRGTLKDFLKFLETAFSSLNEVEYLLDFMHRKSIISTPDYDAIEPVRKEATAVLNGLMKSLRLRLKISNDWQRNLGEEHIEYLTGDTDSVDE